MAVNHVWSWKQRNSSKSLMRNLKRKERRGRLSEIFSNISHLLTNFSGNVWVLHDGTHLPTRLEWMVMWEFIELRTVGRHPEFVTRSVTCEVWRITEMRSFSRDSLRFSLSFRSRAVRCKYSIHAHLWNAAQRLKRWNLLSTPLLPSEVENWLRLIRSWDPHYSMLFSM